MFLSQLKNAERKKIQQYHLKTFIKIFIEYINKTRLH